jgi:hypothetical protein
MDVPLIEQVKILQPETARSGEIHCETASRRRSKQTRSQALEITRAIVNAAAKEMEGPAGFLWFEALDAQRKTAEWR